LDGDTEDNGCGVLMYDYVRGLGVIEDVYWIGLAILVSCLSFAWHYVGFSSKEAISYHHVSLRE
jgi:hypothetical protein